MPLRYGLAPLSPFQAETASKPAFASTVICMSPLQEKGSSNDLATVTRNKLVGFRREAQTSIDSGTDSGFLSIL